MDDSYPLRRVKAATIGLVAPRDSPGRTTVSPKSSADVISIRIIFVTRIPQQKFELSSRVLKNPIQMFLNSGSTRNYISQKILEDFNSFVELE